MPQLASVGRLMGPRRVGWTPRNLGSSLFAWWSADRSDLITLSGSQVTHWYDVVAGYDMAQAVSGSRPIYSTTSFNGSPGVTFDGIDDELTLGSQPFPSGANASELWGLIDQPALAADTGTRCIFGYGGGGVTTQRRIQRAVLAGQNLVLATAGNGSSAVDAFSGAEFFGRHVARGVFTATNETPYLDSVAGSSQAVVPSTGTTRARIGAAPNSTATSFLQGVARDIITTGPLTAAQATLLETYLYNRRNP